MAVKLTPKERLLSSAIAKYKGRTNVMVSQLGIHHLGAKRIYKEVNGRTPPSGLLPESTETNFLPIQRMQSSLLVNMYEKSLARIITDTKSHELVEAYVKDQSVCSKAQYEKALKIVNEDKTHAFVATYSTYKRVCGDQARIDINRFDFLLRDSYKTVDLSSPKRIINWTRCKKCKAKILRQWHEVQTMECPYCLGAFERSRNLTSAFREKAINRSIGNSATI